MTKPYLPALAALVLLAGCGGGDEPANNVGDGIEITGNDEIVVPEPANAGNLANASEAAAPAINLAPDGLTLVAAEGSARQLTFGVPRATAVQSVGAALGNPVETGEMEDCGAGAMSFANFRGGLSLYFQEGELQGWDLDGPDAATLTTAQGIGIGSTRKQIEAAGPIEMMDDSTIGIEFTAGGMSGLLSSKGPEGKVTNLWAGINCIAR